MKPLSVLAQRKKMQTYCPVVDKDVEITKWYSGKGDIKDVGNPDVYFLMCETPWRERVERAGKFDLERKAVQEPCGQNRRCPVLREMWDYEIREIHGMGKFLISLVQSPKPAAEPVAPRSEKDSMDADPKEVRVMENMVDGLIAKKSYNRRVMHFLRLAENIMNMGDYRLMMDHLESAMVNARSKAEASSIVETSDAMQELYRLKHGTSKSNL